MVIFKDHLCTQVMKDNIQSVPKLNLQDFFQLLPNSLLYRQLPESTTCVCACSHSNDSILNPLTTLSHSGKTSMSPFCYVWPLKYLSRLTILSILTSYMDRARLDLRFPCCPLHQTKGNEAISVQPVYQHHKTLCPQSILIQHIQLYWFRVKAFGLFSSSFSFYTL